MVRCFFCPPIIITHIHLIDASDPSCRRLPRTGIHHGRSRFSRTHGVPAVGTAVVVLVARRPALRLGLPPRNPRQQAHDVRSCDFFLKGFSCASSHVINVEERRHQERPSLVSYFRSPSRHLRMLLLTTPFAQQQHSHDRVRLL